MTARLIDGDAISRRIREELAVRVRRLRARSGVVPGLAVLLAGDDPASHVYVRNKQRACARAGISSVRYDLPATVTTAELVELIGNLNHRDDVHGILVQLPLPPQVQVRRVLEAIDMGKDVDGFHPANVGGVVVGEPLFPPCTPSGVLELLAHEDIEVAGRNVVVVGASNIVGKPLSLMLVNHDATVSICHAKTRDLAQFTRLADILVVAAGVPGLVTADMVREGAVVIDVGINREPGSRRIVGDVDFEGVRRKASYLTPVPGGVGPMTVTMLLQNTVTAAERSHSAAVDRQMSHPA
ncbi:bifunctional methylenetetrahydrofolate dehydrogenase/methenyltetrahydrofolate cyclohydrolase FolD [Amycolatopsis endophytica]|uniref:Bifunctional protein FolD n=1 Tax=Amycolatopsis endophytica TaxID=860233 RepID=A0A853B8E8_9PSEU|nr:bifunctional methylenetetrahydrofolate dehydrogenase/methenyltetrahydrofolate cyclohydrolase FolD [Amycolatopsis endophytica]NYI91593.1 methylenetetrahydrofolate dehydrogenase (NADP+)/methenyltetrahydrofolate cyclohydrolase [Amycolatopsis endophytica]